MATEIEELKIDTAGMIAGIKTAKIAFGGLDRVLSSISERLRDVFSVKGYSDYKDTVTRFGKDLADSLLTLQLSFGRMKYAIADSLAPIAAVFVPMLNAAIQAVCRFAGVVGQLLRGVLAGITGNRALTSSAREATSSQRKLGSASKAAAKAVKRSLASFDQLERLNRNSHSGSGGGTGGGIELWGGFQPDPISPGVQAMVDKVLALLAPLMAIDLEPLRLALQTLWTAFTGLAGVTGDALSFLWYELLTPFAAWVLETLAPALVQGIAAKLDAVTAAAGPVTEGLKLLWEALKPVTEFIGQAVIRVLESWKNTYLELTAVFQEKAPEITGIFENIGEIAGKMWEKVGPVLLELEALFFSVFDGVSRLVAATAAYMIDTLFALTAFLSGDFTGSWQEAWTGAKAFLKTTVNGMIGLMNKLISGVVSALNSVIRAANKLSFTLPSWIPDIGGKSFGLNLRTVSAPKIPYLARGAVLPANRPFLAMVGDQRHGTNVEAPLATIQEAVALVMEEQLTAVMAGFEALLAENRQLRRVVEGIELGDTTIGQAAGRYQQSLAIMRGA